MDDDAIGLMASHGADIAAKYATAVHRLMQQRITQVHREAVCLRTALAATADTSPRGQALLPLSAAVAAHHRSVLTALVADVIAYGALLGARVPDDVLALRAHTAD